MTFGVRHTALMFLSSIKVFFHLQAVVYTAKTTARDCKGQPSVIIVSISGVSSIRPVNRDAFLSLVIRNICFELLRHTASSHPYSNLGTYISTFHWYGELV